MFVRPSPQRSARVARVALRWTRSILGVCPPSISERLRRERWFATVRMRAYHAAGERVVAVPPHGLRFSLNLLLSDHRDYASGSYSERHVLDEMLRRVRPGDVAIDVGAFIGYHTVHLAAAVGEAGSVIAFEPVPELMGRLEANLRLNGVGNTRIEPMAISDSTGRADLAVARKAGVGNETSTTSSLVRARGDEHISVATITLDDYVQQSELDRLDFIKIDVEGAELAALTGASDTLRSLRPTLIIEVNDEGTRTAVSAFLETHGYNASVLGAVTHGWHLLCEPSDR